MMLALPMVTKAQAQIRVRQLSLQDSVWLGQRGATKVDWLPDCWPERTIDSVWHCEHLKVDTTNTVDHFRCADQTLGSLICSLSPSLQSLLISDVSPGLDPSLAVVYFHFHNHCPLSSSSTSSLHRHHRRHHYTHCYCYCRCSCRHTSNCEHFAIIGRIKASQPHSKAVALHLNFTAAIKVP